MDYMKRHSFLFSCGCSSDVYGWIARSCPTRCDRDANFTYALGNVGHSNNQISLFKVFKYDNNVQARLEQGNAPRRAIPMDHRHRRASNIVLLYVHILSTWICMSNDNNKHTVITWNTRFFLFIVRRTCRPIEPFLELPFQLVRQKFVFYFN